MFCLLKEHADSFIQALKDGRIDPAKLSDMSSEERNKYLSQFVGKDNATGVNSLFESKLLLKNQQRGMITWAKQVSGIKPAARRDLIAKIENMQHVLDPAEGKQFLKDLTETRLGVSATTAEAKKIADLSRSAQAAEQAPRSSMEDSLKKGWEPSANDLQYGRARYDITKYVSDLKAGANKFKLSDLKDTNILQAAPRLAKGVLDVSKSIGASLDDSFALRQGLKTFWTNNGLWRKEFLNSFVNIAKGFKNSDEAHKEFNARLMADPHYDQAIKDGLAITKHDDVFPTSLPEKIPIAGRAFGASEVAYSAFAQNLRLGVYKNEMRIAQSLGKDVPKDFGKNMAKMANSLTGRGGFGAGESLAGHINAAFYSLRFLKSNLDTLLLHPLGSGVGGTLDKALGRKGAVGVSAAQKKAATNLVKIISGTAAILGTAQALKPGSVEWDPRSSDFGKIKIGDTRFDVTGGMSSLVTLAGRQLRGESKSSSTGAITKLDGSNPFSNRWTVGFDFLDNKLSPVGGAVRDFAKGQDPAGNKFTPASEAGKLVTPIGIQNANELLTAPHGANALAGIIADGLGISTNTYGPSKKVSANVTDTKLSQALNTIANSKDTQKLNARAAKLKSSFNPNDYAVAVLSKKNQENLVKQGAVSQNKVNKIRQEYKDKKKQLGYYKK